MCEMQWVTIYTHVNWTNSSNRKTLRFKKNPKSSKDSKCVLHTQQSDFFFQITLRWSHSINKAPFKRWLWIAKSLKDLSANDICNKMRNYSSNITRSNAIKMDSYLEHFLACLELVSNHCWTRTYQRAIPNNQKVSIID